MNKGNFYFISDDYYEKFKEEKLMTNKEVINGQIHNRPCYYAFKDDKNDDIFWMIPVSSQTTKYQAEYDKSIERYGICDTISFGYLKGDPTTFLLQNMCPITSKYIINEYYNEDTGKPIKIPSDLKRELNAKARKILRKANECKALTFTNILKMKNILLLELEAAGTAEEETE